MRAVFQGDSGSLRLLCSLPVGKGRIMQVAKQLISCQHSPRLRSQTHSAQVSARSARQRDQFERPDIPLLRLTIVSKSITDTQIYGGISSGSSDLRTFLAQHKSFAMQQGRLAGGKQIELKRGYRTEQGEKTETQIYYTSNTQLFQLLTDTAQV